jgi:hypothetical protein
VKLRALVIAGALVVVLVIAAGVALHVRRTRPTSHVEKGSAATRAPEGQRIRVEVINATNVHGLARHATEFLRDHGFDVVEVGTTAELRDSTLVLDRSQHPDWAGRIAAALGHARVEGRPDSSHYVDATVFLGASWRPPAEPFHP